MRFITYTDVENAVTLWLVTCNGEPQLASATSLSSVCQLEHSFAFRSTQIVFCRTWGGASTRHSHSLSPGPGLTSTSPHDAEESPHNAKQRHQYHTGTALSGWDHPVVSQPRHLVLHPDWLPAATVREIRWSGEEELSTNL